MTALDEYARHSPHLFTSWAYPRELESALRGCAGGTYLDVGSGDGAKLYSLREDGLLKKFSRVIATDLSPMRIESLKAHLAGVEAFVADACALPFEDESIDFLVADQVIEHVPSDEAMAREVRRVLAPGGRAYVGSVMKLRGGWYFYRNGGKWRIDPTHLREYSSLNEFLKIFEDAGLDVQASHVDTLRFPVTDAVVLTATRLGILKRDTAVALYTKTPSFDKLRRAFAIPIPRYRNIGVVVGRKS